jgi:hypothetical protein
VTRAVTGLALDGMGGDPRGTGTTVHRVGLAFSATLLTASFASLGSPVADVTTADECVATSSITGVEVLSADGARSDLGSTDLAGAVADWRADGTRGRIFHYRIGPGEVAVVVPPSGLAADQASPQERATNEMPFGDASEATKRPADPAEMCVRPRSNAVTLKTKSNR